MYSKELAIIKVESEGISTLQQICRQTFIETFADCNTEENMQKYLDKSFSLSNLQSELNDKNVSCYFVYVENEVVGYLKINEGSAQTDLNDDRAIEIERIYVLKKFYGKMVGQALLEKAKEFARQKAADFIWLGVCEKNERAIKFYKKHGFIEFGKHIFNLGYDEQMDLMMKLEL